MKTDCTSCGCLFTSPEVDSLSYVEGHALSMTTATRSECPACSELGQAPPPAPCCDDGKLRGVGCISWADDHLGFECDECSTRYSVPAVRRYALGLAVERIVRETPSARGLKAEVALAVAGRVVTAAADLGIRAEPHRG